MSCRAEGFFGFLRPPPEGLPEGLPGGVVGCETLAEEPWRPSEGVPAERKAAATRRGAVPGAAAAPFGSASSAFGGLWAREELSERGDGLCMSERKPVEPVRRGPLKAEGCRPPLGDCLPGEADREPAAEDIGVGGPLPPPPRLPVLGSDGWAYSCRETASAACSERPAWTSAFLQTTSLCNSL